jgi:integrase
MFHRKKRGNIWYLYWRENGKQKSRAVSPDLQAVKQFELELANRLYAKKNGLLINNVSFDEFCKEYIALYSKPNKRPRSIEKDIFIIRTFKKYCPEIKYVKNFDDNALNSYKVKRKNDGKKVGTINRELGTLKNMMKYAFRKRYIDYNYSPEVTFYPASKQVKDFILAEKDIEKLIANTAHPYKTAFILALYGGMRRGEICHLEWTDIDLKNNIISIKDKPHLGWSPKNKTSSRKVPMHPYLKEYLLTIKILAENKTNFVVFYSQDFSALNEDVLSSMVRKIKIKLGLPKEFCFHSLRHTFVSKMAELGVSTYHISKIIGHSNTNITEQVYTHLKDTSFFKSIEKLEY